MFLLTPLLLQADTALQPAPAVSAAASDSLSLWYLLREGGVLMIPLLLCSLVLVYVFVERWMVLRKAVKYDPYFLLRIREHLTDGNVAGAKSLAKTTSGPVARMVEKGLGRLGRPAEQVDKAMEASARQELYQLERNIGVLSTISRIAPIFGFLGTIAGMIVLFYNIQHQGFSLDAIAGGIYTKMVTSAVGLIIGLLAFVAYDFLNTQINKVSYRLEAAAADMQDAMLEVPQPKYGVA